VLSGADTALVGTKLLVPQRLRGHVPRPQLVSVLEAACGARLALVSAPTGFGKTSLLAEWAAVTRGVRFAWVSLDRGDDDPSHFWRYAIAALERAVPELSGTAGRRLQGPGVSVVDEVLPLLVNELTSVSEPLVLVLDDMHMIESDAVYAQLEYFVDRVPQDVHVVVATQVDPPLRLGRLRALGDLAELRGEALHFSDAEAAELLNGRHGLRLPAAELSALWHRTEGWVAGLNLAACRCGPPAIARRSWSAFLSTIATWSTTCGMRWCCVRRATCGVPDAHVDPRAPLRSPGGCGRAADRRRGDAARAGALESVRDPAGR
jgi:LuxR family maltose regulon positive regulatory protein